MTGTDRGPTATAPMIAVAHYPEGAGHATRMLAIADELTDRGAEVMLAGGGAGTQFVALNGYDEFEPATVDYIDTVQSGSVRDVLTGSLPATANRVADYVDWLRETAPDALVTDDMFAAMAARWVDVPLYVLKHDMPGLYHDRVERAGAAFHTQFQAAAARAFFYPAVWPRAGLAPDGATRVAPIALEGDNRDHEAAEVVVVPSHYSDLGRIATALEREGYSVIDVGSDGWEPVPSLLPYLRDAEVVVCSGYSTVMDAAVAGTPCVVHPATDEQEAVADRLRDDEVTGFAVADDPRDVLDAVDDPPEPPAHENGAPRVAATVMQDLRSTSADTGTEDRSAVGRGTETDWRDARAQLPERRAVVRGPHMVADGTQQPATAVRGAAERVAANIRSAARGSRRYAVAVSAVLASVAMFTGFRARRTRGTMGRSAVTAAEGLWCLAIRSRGVLVAGARAFSRWMPSFADGDTRSERALQDAVGSDGRE